MPTRLTDEEFKQQLKKNHTKRVVTRTISLILILGGILMMFLLYLWFYNTSTGFIMIIAGLVFWGISAMWLSTDKKSLVEDFMKDYKTQTDFEYFGMNLASPGWNIDKDYLINNNPTSKKWDEAQIGNNYEGYSNGVHFTAANVTLIGELDAADLVSDGSLATRRYHAFSGIYIILETKEKAESEFLFCFNDNIGGSKNPLKDGDLSKSYTITAEEPEFGKKFAARYEKFLRRLYAENDFTPHIYYRDNRLNIGIQTIATKFRAINGKTDINDPESFRADYRRSLEYVRNAIDAVREETDLLIADD